jgi:5-methyltetrahydrofolate--homocysteine methyltransferase
MTQTLTQLMNERVVLLDGGMGTQIFAKGPTLEDYGSKELEGCVELLNLSRKEWIQEIHERYFKAGADAVETNTFGANPLVLAEFGIPERAFELNVAAAQLAREVADSFEGGRYVIGSVGPGTKLLTLGHTTYAAMFDSYRTQVAGLLAGGADAILIETCQDLAQIKVATRAARTAMAEAQRQVPLWVQGTVETTGTLLVGTDITSVLHAVEPLGIDVLGLNCATGPDEMAAHLHALAEASPFAISCLPNAGLPRNEGGKVVYPLDPEAFAAKVAQATAQHGLAIVGGCCGTTPDHIRALAPHVKNLAAPHRSPKLERSASSLYLSTALRQEPAPTIVGERTNANGSKAFRDALAKEDWDALVEIAKGQQKEGAHLLDVCVAYVGRDEVRDMDLYLSKLVTQVQLPLMIDSTEVPVIERALQKAPGKCIVNSINFEDGEGKARKILDLCKAYGASIVALTIDEQGMAKTLERKVQVADRLVKLVVEEYGFHPSDLIIDPLTFTLGSGDEEFRGSAVATLEALKAIRHRWPLVNTILGVSNVSFGLAPGSRHILNALMLYHAVQHGLELAIFNASKVIPVAQIDPEARRVFEDLIFDRRQEGYDPLKEILARFSDTKATAKVDRRAGLGLEERLQLDIIEGEKRQVVADVEEALAAGHDPLRLINEVLLEGMKVVGERFGAGEMQLPFVLESAEAMKAAIARIEPVLPKDSNTTKGRLLLATVRGDVHDIGKNLVDIILSNNGFEVRNLGIKQPIEDILTAHADWPADAIGLSGLLVKSTVIMRENLQTLEAKGLDVPVILGGAALTRAYVEQDCRKVYRGPVFYAADAFEGLRLMQRIAGGEPLVYDPAPAPEAAIQVLHRGDRALPLTDHGQSAWVRRNEPRPEPPFWGVREEAPTLGELFSFLDEFVVLRQRWGYQQGTQDEATFQAVLREKAEPELAKWKARLIAEGLVAPKVRYGYFPANADGDDLVVFDPADPTRELHRVTLPRQAAGRRLCIADFFAPLQSGVRDVLPVQLVSLGAASATFAQSLYQANAYGDYYHFHGLCTELTEAAAEWLHARIRRELGIHAKDAANLRILFSQGYQGSRYSFGYPACPDLEGNHFIHQLLNGDALGVTLTESCQMDPEYATSALVAWHPQARYFAI